MIKDVAATLVEIGHSERRTHFGETDETVALKTAAAVKHGLTALVCVGDTREENTMPAGPRRRWTSRSALPCRSSRPKRPIAS